MRHPWHRAPRRHRASCSAPARLWTCRAGGRRSTYQAPWSPLPPSPSRGTAAACLARRPPGTPLPPMITSTHMALLLLWALPSPTSSACPARGTRRTTPGRRGRCAAGRVGAARAAAVPLCCAPREKRQTSPTVSSPLLQSLDYSTLPVQHEAEEEGQEEESATAAATLASAAAAALQRPPPYPRPAALPNEGEATGTPTSGLTAKQGSGLREPLLPHADPGPGSGGGAGTGVHAAGVAPGTAKGRRGGGLQAMPHTPLSRSLVFGMINAVAAIPTLIAFAASEGRPAMRRMCAAAERAAWLAHQA